MPVVPRYQDDVQRAPKSPVNASAESFGASNARALTSIAGGLRSIETEADRIAREDSEARAKKADLGVADKLADWLHNPETGYLSQRGGNAVEQRQAYRDQLKKIETTALDGVEDGRTRRSALGAIQTRIRAAKVQAANHYRTQRDAYHGELGAARITQSERDIASDPMNPEAWERGLGVIEYEIEAAGRRNGLPEEAVAVTKQTAISKAIANQILMQADTDPMAAEAMFQKDDLSKRLTPEDREDVKDKLAPLVRDRRIVAEADQIVGIAPPPPPAVPSQNGGVAPIDIAREFVGKTENADHAAIGAFLTKAGGALMDPRTAAWCARFANAVLAHGGRGGTGSDMARSFLDYGQPVNEPAEGDIVVLWRDDPSSQKGHVGFYAGHDERGRVLILGGNQGDAVSVKAFPEDRVLGYRRPPSPNAPAAVETVRLADIAEPKTVQRIVGLSAQLEAASRIADPEVREGVEKRLRQQHQDMARIEKEQDDALKKSVYTRIEIGEVSSTRDLTGAERIALGPEGLSKVEAYLDSLKPDGQSRNVKAAEENMAVWFELDEMARRDPQRFANYPLEQHFGELTPESLKAFKKRQGEPEMLAPDKIMTGAVDALFASYKIVKATPAMARKSPRDAQPYVRATAIMTELVDQFRTREKREPTEAEILGLARSTLREVKAKSSSWFGLSTTEEMTPIVSLTKENFEAVDEGVFERMRGILQEQGSPATDSDVLAALQAAQVLKGGR